MIRITGTVAGFTTGSLYTMMGACWDADMDVQLDWHAVNDAGVLTVVPIDAAEMV